MHLANWNELKTFHFRIGEIVEGFISSQDVKNIATGRYELSDGCYVNVSECDTRENYKFEAHKLYIDVQVLVEGEEEFFCAELKKGKESVPYNDAKDITFYTCEEGEFEKVTLSPNQALVLLPEDLHAPCNGKPMRIRKLIFKIPMHLYQA